MFELVSFVYIIICYALRSCVGSMNEMQETRTMAGYSYGTVVWRVPDCLAVSHLIFHARARFLMESDVGAALKYVLSTQWKSPNAGYPRTSRMEIRCPVSVRN